MIENGRKIKFAIVGYGHIGKRHAAMIVANPSCELVALCDIKGIEQLSLVDYSNLPFFEDIDELLNSGIEFDVLCIATPNGLHEEHALKGLKRKKHLVIEKPMSLTKTGCEKIIYEALHVHRYVFCVMQNRYSPPSKWLKDIIEQDVLGNLYVVQINCYWNRDNRYYTGNDWHGTKKLDGGTLFTQFSHYVDIMYWLFGDIKNITGHFASFNHSGLTDFEDSGFINFEFLRGGIGSFNYSTSVWRENFETTLTIIAEKGTVKVGGQYMNEIQYCNIENYKMPELPPSNPPNDYGPYKGSAANHHYIFENVVDVLRGQGPITTNAMEGLKIVEIIERIYNSAKVPFVSA